MPARPRVPKTRRHREKISASMKVFHARRKKALALLERYLSEGVLVCPPEERER